MSVYDQAVHDARRLLGEKLEMVHETVYAPFAEWSDLQRLILCVGLIVFLGYIAARPPIVRRRYEDPRPNHGFVLFAMIVIGAFTGGMALYPA